MRSVMQFVRRRRRPNASGGRTKRRVVALAVFLFVAGVSSAALAGASGSDGGGTVTVTVGGVEQFPGSTLAPPGRGVPSRTGPVCTWTQLSTEGVPGLASGGPSGSWYLETCPGANGGLPSTVVVWVPTPTVSVPAPVVVAPTTVAEKAERSIQLPDPGLHFNPSDYSVVNLPTWLWIDSTMWHSYSATASVGRISATAVATPVSVTWSMGDGSSVVCPGPGNAYQPDVPASQQQPECSHAYERSSAGQSSADGNPNDAAFTVVATVEWEVTWTSTVAGEGGSLAPLQTSSSAPVRVEQIQAVDSAS